ncbi:CBS domain-containing protein [Rheinheimera sp. UJ51]|uniref:CBS domain-containing protein n=1 Tax=unclassified Rheinheimera TaxID=115860 RepID=UPI001E302A68|nr:MULTISPECIES: CBS domain-containing protein [unclassified Rheinheimera]MCC5452063.1 CBS domain-containing protein [Rheinheimera sp. UJ51]MCF4009805.1 CBS domain-containing protein [Rheinheimera sp. UJ63]
MSLKLVKDLMQQQVITISAFSSLRDALKLMKQHKIKSLVVERQNAHDAFGLITYSNILKTIIAEDGDIDLINVYDVCVKPTLGVHPELAVKHAAAIMSQHNLKRLVVTDANQLVGLITMNDVVSDIFSLLD